MPGASDVLIPQDVDYPALELDVDREKASLVGLSQKEVVDNVITALTSNGMIAPNYWIDPKSGNPYLLTVQYPEDAVKTIEDLKQIPLRSEKSDRPTTLDTVVNIKTIPTPTEVDHYQIRRVIDVYVMPTTESLSKVNAEVNRLVKAVEAFPGSRLLEQVPGKTDKYHTFFYNFSGIVQHELYHAGQIALLKKAQMR